MHPWTERFSRLDVSRLPSPCFVVDEVSVEENLQILNRVQTESGAKVLLALKAFSMWSLGPLVAKYLSGTCASGLHEALLGREHFGGEVHTYSAAYTDAVRTVMFSTGLLTLIAAPIAWLVIGRRDPLLTVWQHEDEREAVPAAVSG